jgi:signal transduction histidine kinase
MTLDEEVSDSPRRRVLVVDDNPLVTDMLSPELTNRGYLVETENASLRVLERVGQAIRDERSYDAIVLDIDMPKMNGFDVARRLVSAHQAVPIVFYSGEQGNPVAVEILQQLSVSRNSALVEELTERLKALSEGLPITYLKKFSSAEGTNWQGLLGTAIEAMSNIGAQRMDSLERFLETFSSSTADYHFDNPHLARMVDTQLVTKEIFERLKRDLAAFEAEIDPAKFTVFNRFIDKAVAILGSKDASMESLRDERYGRSRIHFLDNILSPSFCLNVLYISLPPFNRYMRESAGQSPEIAVRLKGLHDEFSSSYTEMTRAWEYHRVMSKKPETSRTAKFDSDIRTFMEYLPDFGFSEPVIRTDLGAGTAIFADYGDLTKYLVLHPLLNALEAARATEEPYVLIRTRVKDISELPEPQRDYFSQTNPKLQQVGEVLISDLGAGIPLDIQPRIFDEGFTTKGRGGGHGLAFVHQRIKDVGGACRLESVVGEGTDFYLYFPLVEPAK